ncbi:type II toxin-antitoxin system VapB family antitoxin [Baaleninema sp.]
MTLDVDESLVSEALQLTNLSTQEDLIKEDLINLALQERV